MLTFQNLYQEAQEGLGDTSAATLVVLKRGLNQALHLFRAAMNREFTTTRRTFTITADQQFYQGPEDMIRGTSVTVTVGTVAYPLTEIVSEQQWRLLNARAGQSSDIPEFFYLRGTDEFGIWPIPSSTLASGGELVYEARQRDLSADNYAIGTIAVTQDSAAIVGTGTVFTASMVGRSFKVDDGSPDGIWYKIASFTDATHMTLENIYEGNTVSGVNYIVGELPDLPEEFHINLVDYALYRGFRRRRDLAIAKEYKQDFDIAVVQAKQMYAMKGSSQLIKPAKIRHSALWTREPDVATGS